MEKNIFLIEITFLKNDNIILIHIINYTFFRLFFFAKYLEACDKFRPAFIKSLSSFLSSNLSNSKFWSLVLFPLITIVISPKIFSLSNN